MLRNVLPKGVRHINYNTLQVIYDSMLCDILPHITEFGTIEILEYIIKKYPNNLEYHNLYNSAVSGENLKMLQYLWKNNFKIDMITSNLNCVIECAMKTKNKQIIHWVIKNYPYKITFLDEKYIDKFQEYKEEILS